MARPATFLIVALAACASTPPPGPADHDSAVLAVRVRTLRRADGGWGNPQTVHFVRIESEAGDPGAVHDLIPSTHVHGNVAYLLNAPPGRYHAVACTEKINGKTWNSYFPRALIEATGTVVEPGRLASMGAVVVHLARVGKRVDPVQEHYMRVLEPDWTRRNLVTQLFARSRIFVGVDYRHRRPDEDVARRAREHLATGGWTIRGDRPD